MRKPNDPRPLWQHLLALGAVTLALVATFLPVRSAEFGSWNPIVISYSDIGVVDNFAPLPGFYATFDACMAAVAKNKSLQEHMKQQQREARQSTDADNYHIDITCESELD